MTAQDAEWACIVLGLRQAVQTAPYTPKLLSATCNAIQYRVPALAGFTRVDAVSVIGLAQCQQLIRRHGGR